MADKNSIRRYRNFATMVYPESAADGWQDILSDFHAPVFISPLHDKDVNPTGEPKKPHYHVMFMFEGKKSPEQLHDILGAIGAVGLEPVQSLRGYARYLCHLDNPEKAQYRQEDVRCMGGADYTAAIGLTLDKYKAIREMIDYCEENDIVSYSVLLKYCCSERFDWFRVLCDNGTVVMKEFLKSRYWTGREEQLYRCEERQEDR